MDEPETPSSDDIGVIESFVISLYSVSSTLTDVNKARQQIFAQSSRTFEYLPPTKAALVEHIKRTTHLAGYVSVLSPGFVKGMGGTSIYLFLLKGRGGNIDFQGTTLRH